MGLVAVPEGFITSLTLSDGAEDMYLWPAAGAGRHVVDVDFGFPSIRENMVDRVGVSGTRDYTTTYGASVVSMTLQVVPTDGFSVQAYLDEIRKFMHPSKRPVLTWEPVGATERFYTMRPGSASNALSMRSLRGGTTQIQLQFKVPEGRAFGTTLYSEELLPNTGLGSGRDYDTTYDRTYEDLVPPYWSQLIGGNTETFAVATIHGPVSSPSLSNLTEGMILAFDDYTLGTGDTIVVDFANKTAKLNGVTSLRSELTSRDWWSMKPGINQIGFDTDSYSASTKVVLEWREAYL